MFIKFPRFVDNVTQPGDRITIAKASTTIFIVCDVQKISKSCEFIGSILFQSWCLQPHKGSPHSCSQKLNKHVQHCLDRMANSQDCEAQGHCWINVTTAGVSCSIYEGRNTKSKCERRYKMCRRVARKREVGSFLHSGRTSQV